MMPTGTEYKIFIQWAGRIFNYVYLTEYIGSAEIWYRLKFASGQVVLIRNIQTDTWQQQHHPGQKKLPQNFVDIVGAEILRDQRPK